MSSRYRNANTQVDKFALPKESKALGDLVAGLWDTGYFRVEIDSHKQIAAYKEQEKHPVDPGAPELFDEPNMDLDTVLRTVELLEYVNTEDPAAVCVGDILHLITTRNLHPVLAVTGLDREHLLDKWLEFSARKLPADVRSLFGMPVFRLQSLPEDGIIICGATSPDAEFEEITLAVRTAVEVRSGNVTTEVRGNVPSRQADDRVRDSGPKGGRPTRSVEDLTRGLLKVGWGLPR